MSPQTAHGVPLRPRDSEPAPLAGLERSIEWYVYGVSAQAFWNEAMEAGKTVADAWWAGLALVGQFGGLDWGYDTFWTTEPDLMLPRARSNGPAVCSAP